MARFHFRLQKVLDARRAFEDNAKREFGAVQRETARLREIRDSLIKQRMSFLVEMGERRKQKLPVQLFVKDIQYEWLMRQKIKERKEAVKKAEMKMGKKREELVLAMKKRKIMEKLRERRWEEFVDENKAEELKFADEIAGRNAFFPVSSASVSEF